MPQSKQVAEKIWQIYKHYKGEVHVVRSGFGLYGIYPYDINQPFMCDKPESDLEHSAGVAMLVHLLAIFYPDLIPPAELASFMLAAEAHEIGEVEIGDIPDDGRRDEQLKVERERAAIAKFARELPEPVREDLLAFFEEFIQKSTARGRILYMVDKLETILQGLIYESEGRVGDVRNVCRFFGQISEQDQSSFMKTNSYALADLWAVHFVERACKYPEAGIFLEILEVAVQDVRGREFSWLDKYYP